MSTSTTPAHCGAATLFLSALLACLVLCTSGSELANGDYMLNWLSPQLFRQIYQMNSDAFKPNEYVDALFNAYGAASPNTITRESIALVEWCPWPNASLASSVKDAFCIFGADSVGTTSPQEYVLVSYQLQANNASLQSLAISLPAPYQNPISDKPSFTPVDPALYNPDEFTDDDGETGLIQSVVGDSVAFWAIFGCLIGVVVLLAIGLAVCRCYRDRKQRERNTDMLRGVMRQYQTRERQTFLQSFLGTSSRSGKKKNKHGRKGRRYGAEDPNDVRNRYDVAEYADDMDAPSGLRLGAGAAAAATSTVGSPEMPTSRASAYWPGAEPGDREMEERENSYKKSY